MNIGFNTALNSSIQTMRYAERTSRALEKSLERLSTGKRVNEASDDMASLSQISKLEARVRGMNQAVRNLNDGASALSTADAALSSQLDIVQRMRELAVQGANGGLSTQDRAGMNEELSELLTEFRRISTETEFNGVKLLDGTFGTRSLQVGADLLERIQVNVGTATSASVFKKTVGTGKFTATATNSALAVGATFANGDFNNDGKLDYVSATSAGTVVQTFLNRGDGTFYGRASASVPLGSGTVVTADFNRDGNLDLAVGSSILLGNGDGTFQKGKTFSSSALSGIDAGDLNGDGIPDIASPGIGLSTFLGNGDGTFRAGASIALSSASPTEVKIADFNGDGLNDLVSTDASQAYAHILLNQGGGNFGNTASSSLSITSISSFLRTGDVDNDGDTDLFVFDADVTESWIFKNNGNGSFDSGTVFGTDYAEDTHLVDINGDDFLDVVGSDASDLRFQYNNGSGSFASTTRPGISALYSTWGDFSGDGVQDAVVSRATTAQNYYAGVSRSAQADSEIRVTTQANAQSLLNILDTAMSNLVTARSGIASLQRRVESAASFGSTQGEGYASAKAVLESTDIAEETAQLTQSQILQQAQVAVFAQGNVQAQVVMGLLVNMGN